MPQTDSAKCVALFAVAKRRANFAPPFRQALGGIKFFNLARASGKFCVGSLYFFGAEAGR